MTIYRGPGGTGEARTDTDVTEVRIVAEEALGYKNDAAASASAASASAAAALTYKTAAETAETNAETAEANAETAQAAAEAALASAQAVYDNFDDRYLGPKSSDPTVDNDGNALVTGALYFNTTVPEMRVYTGSAWIDFSAGATVSSFNTRTGAVTLTDTDVNTALGYTAANSSLVALKANNLSDLASASTARTNLGLGTAALVADSSLVHTTGTETIAGVKTFSNTILGSISGNAGTVTNGVVTTGSYADPAWIASLAGSKVSGNIAGNAANVTGTVAVATGGTGATTASDARTNLDALAATNPSYSGTLTGSTGVVNLGSGQFYKDASGNVGIGTSSPGVKLEVSSTADIFRLRTSTARGSGNGFMSFSDPTGRKAYLGYGAGDDNFYIANEMNAATLFITNSVERARIDSSGNLLVGTTSANGVGWTVSPSGAGQIRSSGTTSQDKIQFANTNGVVGAITTNGSSTSYFTSSDYRLKESIAPMVGALATVTALKPVTYKWKIDGSDGQGFIAHELQEVVPDCVIGEKDAVDADGNPRYQGIDTSFLVATLTAAIQEQQAIILAQQTALTALTARVEALE